MSRARGPRFERHGDHEEIRDDLAAFALGALPAREHEELRRHLEDCEGCRARLRWLEPAIDVLPASVEQLTPPDRLRESLLATVRDEALREGHARADAGRAGAAAPAGRTAAGEPWWRRSLGFALRPAGALAAMALLAAGLAGGYALGGGGDGAESGAESAFVEAEVPAPLRDSVSATLERHGDSATLHVHELPKLGRDEVYEVWLARGGAMEPAGIFVLADDRSGTAAVTGPLGGADAVLVTREPRPGSAQPTNPPLLRAEL